MPTAKVFWSGNSQAVRLPKEFRYGPEVNELAIRRNGDQLILERVTRREWPDEVWQAFEEMPADFERPSQGSPRRERLDL